MDRLTLYPNKELMKKLKFEATKEKRSLNNLILFIVGKYFETKKMKGGKYE